MKSSRFFVLLFCVSVFIFLMANFILWKLWVEDIRTAKYVGGDLSRIGYLYNSKMPRHYRNNFIKRHLPFQSFLGEKIDILTVGDSFSNMDRLGEDAAYQDHVASHYDINILNFMPKLEGLDPVENLIKLYNSGELTKIAPRYVILESAGRLLMRRLGVKRDFSLTPTEEEIDTWRKKNFRERPYQPKFFDFITEANAKFLCNRIWYPLTNHNSDGKVYIARLNRDFFSVKNSDLLTYTDVEMRVIKKITQESMQLLNDNLNTLSDLLAEKGITLVFMPVVDKYDLYYDYLLDDTLPQNPLFDYLRSLEKRYLFLDTKAILSPAVARGEKDIWYADDTHWSANACRHLVPHFESLMPELTQPEGIVASLHSETGE